MFLKGMIHGVVQKMPKKSGRRKSLDDRHGRKIIRSLRADRKASLSDITNRFNNSENINVCKKNQCGGIVGAYAGRKYEFGR
jgi:hypothetical protein